MKKAKVMLLLAASVSVFGLAGCQKEANTVTEKLPVVSTASTEEQVQPVTGQVVEGTVVNQETAAQPEENLPEGMCRSYLTGKLVSTEIGQKRPVAVMLNNIIDACPQAGIAQAEVVYEAPVEGGITRLMGIFEDYKDLEKIGSVRSCRNYYVKYAEEFDAIYVHYGQAVYAVDLLNSDEIDNISGLQYQDGVGAIDGYVSEDIFYRTDDRPSPHNCYTSGDRILSAIEQKEYDTEYSKDYKGHYKFAADGQRSDLSIYGAQNATKITPGYGVNEPWFEYNAEDQKYYRFQYGDKQIDQVTEEQLAYDNVIVQFSPWEKYDDNGYLNIDTFSGGTGYFFTGGKVVPVTWIKDEGVDGAVRYYVPSGDEIVLNQGKTWVCIVLNSEMENMKYE